MKARNKSLRGVGRVPAVVLCSLLLGAFCGFVFAKTGLFELTEGFSKTGVILADLWMLAAFALTFFLNIALHEAGHLIFGLLSGYGFVSYRLGSLMWMRENGRIVLKRFSLAGTGGQCLMSPPGGPDGDFPLMMYNFGGAAVNLATAALLGALTAIGAVRGSLVFLPLCLFGGLSALYLAVVNGIPLVLGPVPNDGWNALHLAADPQARRAFWVTLKVNELQHRGVRLKDMSAEWFALPSEEAMKNGLIATSAVLAENRAMDACDLSAAEAIIPAILADSCRAADLYKKLAVCDAVTCALIREGAAADVSPLKEKGTAPFLRRMRDFPSVLRTRYAEALLKNRDETAAAKVLAHFDRVALSYPAPADIAAERDLMALIRKTYDEAK